MERKLTVVTSVLNFQSFHQINWLICTFNFLIPDIKQLLDNDLSETEALFRLNRNHKKKEKKKQKKVKRKAKKKKKNIKRKASIRKKKLKERNLRKKGAEKEQDHLVLITATRILIMVVITVIPTRRDIVLVRVPFIIKRWLKFFLLIF
jgi:hypothetical protein